MTLYQQVTGSKPNTSPTSAVPLKKGEGISPKSQKPSASPSGKMQALQPSGQTRELLVKSTAPVGTGSEGSTKHATVFASGAGSPTGTITDDVYIWAVDLAPSGEENEYPKPIFIVSNDTAKRTIATFYTPPGFREGTARSTYYKFPGAIYCPGGFDVDTSASASTAKTGALTIFYSLADQGSITG